jgi:hypothetical protein
VKVQPYTHAIFLTKDEQGFSQLKPHADRLAGGRGDLEVFVKAGCEQSADQDYSSENNSARVVCHALQAERKPSPTQKPKSDLTSSDAQSRSALFVQKPSLLFNSRRHAPGL